MGFIREYSEAGDPFSLRRPKWMKRLKPGKLLGKAVSVAGFIPGIGIPARAAGLVSKLATGRKILGGARAVMGGGGGGGGGGVGGFGLGQRLAAIAARYGHPHPEAAAEEFARGYGVAFDEEGDPYEETDEFGGGMSRYMQGEAGDDMMGDPGSAPKPAKKRKSAGAGPKAKAAKKRGKRKERAARKGGGFNLGASLGAGARAVGSALPGLVSAFQQGGPTGAMAHMAGGGGPEDAMIAEMGQAMGGKVLKGHFGGKRRSMNAGNVKALRRSLRRVDSFAKLANRVQKDAAKILRHVHRERPAHHSSRGHRAGCGCFACKKRG